jgi:hypothetical protein
MFASLETKFRANTRRVSRIFLLPTTYVRSAENARWSSEGRHYRSTVHGQLNTIPKMISVDSTSRTVTTHLEGKVQIP